MDYAIISGDVKNYEENKKTNLRENLTKEKPMKNSTGKSIPKKIKTGEAKP